MNPTPLDNVLAHLAGVKRSGEQWVALCPSHGDERNPHLYINEGDNEAVLLHCHKGCTTDEVLGAMGLEMTDLFPPKEKSDKKGPRKEVASSSSHKIRDAHGNVVAIHHRKPEPRPDDPKHKRVWWTGPNGKPGLAGRRSDDLPLYGCHHIVKKGEGGNVVLVEGETAAEALLKTGIPAVGTVTGADNTPSKKSLAFLEGRTVILWPDNDDLGVKHMRRVGKMLQGIATEILWHEWEGAPEKGDAADHPLTQPGAGRDGALNLATMLKRSPTFHPPHDPLTDGAGSMSHFISESRAMRRQKREGGGVTGIRAGLPTIDQGLHGFNKGNLYYFAARPSEGKSVCIGQFALHAAMQGHRVLLQSAEMAAFQYLQRMAYYYAEVSYFRGMAGRTTDQEERLVDASEEDIGAMPLIVDDLGSQNIDRIRRNIEQHEPDILFVDYLQYLIPDDSRASRTQQVGQLSRDLARIKGDYNIPVVAAAQLNRKAEDREGRRPMMSDLRDSGEIEQDADAIMLIHRPNRFKKDEEDTIVEIDCQKFRQGITWFAEFHFVPDQMFITDKEINYVGRAS